MYHTLFFSYVINLGGVQNPPMLSIRSVALLAFTGLVSCSAPEKEKRQEAEKGTYAYDVAFLNKYEPTIELKNGDAKVLLSAKYQGRVMTSTAGGDSGTSYGWLNYSLIESGKFKSQFNPVGGEERFWLGPEGGQYSLYFAPGTSFDIGAWQVPPVIDTLAFDVTSSSDNSASFAKSASLTNFSGTKFEFGITRTITLLTGQELKNGMRVDVPANVKYVAYRTDNSIVNNGDSQWTKDKGLISIWLLGMFTPSDSTTVIIPFRNVPGAKEKITTSYFGTIPADRLNITDSVLYFQCDGKYRSKIGLPPSIAKPVAGSFDAANNILTITMFAIHEKGLYVNSKWELQKDPFSGDVVNSYNDGPLADGSQLGPFYEIESSSQALELKKGESQSFSQITCHFEGPRSSLSELARTVLGISLDDIK